MLGTDEVKSIVVLVHAVVNVDGVHVDALALDNTNAVVCAVQHGYIADREVFAVVHQHVIRPSVSSKTAGRRSSTGGRVELCALTVNGSRALNREILRVH